MGAGAIPSAVSRGAEESRIRQVAASISKPPSRRGANTTQAAVSDRKPPSQPAVPRQRWIADGTVSSEP